MHTIKSQNSFTNQNITLNSLCEEIDAIMYKAEYELNNIYASNCIR